MRYLLLLTLVTSCAGLSMTEQAARTGYMMAVYCTDVHYRPYDSFKKKFVANRFLIIVEEDTVKHAIAAADLSSNTILMAQPYKHSPKIWGHEFVHHLAQVRNHPDSLFERCNLK